MIISFYWSEFISFKNEISNIDNFIKLISKTSILSKKMSGIKARPFIRVVAIGKKNCPHMHIICGANTMTKIEKICSKIWANQYEIVSNDIYNIDGLLGYFFDQNFYPTYFHPDRIKGIRLITGSRPMRCGFPSNKQIYEMYNQTIGIAESKFEPNDSNWNGTESQMQNGDSI